MIQWKFEKTWGGNDNWYTKSKRWANKQKFPIISKCFSSNFRNF